MTQAASVLLGLPEVSPEHTLTRHLLLGKQGTQLQAVMQAVWPDSDAASGRTGVCYPTEVGGGGQDMWAELREAEDPVKDLPSDLSGSSREDFCSLHRHLIPGEGE